MDNTNTNPATGQQVAKNPATQDLPYIYNREVVIALASDITQSLWRKVNYKALDDRRDNIGASISAVNSLLGGTDELKKYMPNIIGVSSQAIDYPDKVKVYFNNISKPVTGAGLTLNISFKFDKESYYKEYAETLEAIESRFDSADVSTPLKYKEAVENKYFAIHDLESKLYQFGTPIKVEDYILYRYLILYKDCANDPMLINGSSVYRFYIRDINREAKRKQSLHEISMKATVAFVKLMEDKAKFDAVFDLISKRESWYILNLSSADRQIELKKYSEANPKKFLEICNDKHLYNKALIEKLIDMGELIRLPNSQNVVNSDNDLIGANMQECIAYLQNPVNAGIVSMWKKKLNIV